MLKLRLGSMSTDYPLKWKRLVSVIVRQAETLRDMDDHTLRKRSLALKYQALSGQPLDQLLVDAYALVREASRRTVQMQHYDVQLMGGIAMYHRSIVVMQTGEGKTLAASLPLYLNALTGMGSHLATANDYLASRDAQLMKPIYNALGLSVGLVQTDSTRPQRQSAYQCDITYSTAKEFGFDFLRDRLLQRRAQLADPNFVAGLLNQSAASVAEEAVQPGLNFVVVDEADSILIDEARTPLIVSSVPDEIAQASVALYRWCAEISQEFRLHEHYLLKPKTNQIQLTADGRRLARKSSKPKILGQTPIADLYDQLEQTIYVNVNYIRDRHYIVQDGEIVIVDEFTGRLAEGRKWRTGIHQAIEARENLDVSVETSEAARITIQDFFLRYHRLAGMTGTVGNSASELSTIFKVRITDIPTHRPSRRQPWTDLVFGSSSQKWEAIVDEVEAVHKTGRPVLIGTRSIDKSEMLSAMLSKRCIDHQVLNARHLAEEAMIVAAAGRCGHVTVATNMAGRGTDIKLDAKALELGGLHVICSELHESARIDRQLIGRCGRQGDMGTYRHFMSLDDDLLKVALGESKMMELKRYGTLPAYQLSRLASRFRRAQRSIEQQHFAARKVLLHRENLRREIQMEMGQDPYLDVAGAQ